MIKFIKIVILVGYFLLKKIFNKKYKKFIFFKLIFIFIMYNSNSIEGQIAQSVEQRTENPRVGGSIPSLATTSFYLDYPPYYENPTI